MSVCVFVHVCAYARILLLADVPVPPELLAECKLVKEGSDGWMWDPFLASLRHEYLDCAGSDGQVLEAIPIAQQVVVEGQVLISAMHFITEYYLEITLTLSFMYSFSIIQSLRLMRQCMDGRVISDSMRCACDVVSAHFLNC